MLKKSPSLKKKKSPFAEGLQSVFPFPATPIPMTYDCSHAGSSDRVPLGKRSEKHHTKVDVTLNPLEATQSISVEGKVARI